MRICVIMCIVMTLLTGCWWNKEYIIKCPAPENVPATVSYQTDVMSETTNNANAIRMLLEDLLICQNTESQLRLILNGYQK